MRRTYSQEEREQALVMCVASGQYQASKNLGIPQSTLEGWVKKSGQRSNGQEKMRAATEAREIRIASKRAELKELLIVKALDLAHRMDESHIDFKGAGPMGPVEVTFPKAPAAACQHYATSIGILIDKFRLESGESTSRGEVTGKDGGPVELHHDLSHMSDEDLLHSVVAEAEGILGREVLGTVPSQRHTVESAPPD